MLVDTWKSRACGTLVRSSLRAGSAVCMNSCGWLARTVTSLPVHASDQDDRRRSEEHSDDEEIRPVEQHLSDLADAHPDAAAQLGTRRAERHRWQSRRKDLPIASGRPAPGEPGSNDLRAHPSNREGVNAKARGDQPDGHGSSDNPGKRLRAREERQVLHTLEDSLKDPQRKRQDERDDDDAKRKGQQGPAGSHDPPRDRAEDDNEGKLPQHQPRGAADQLLQVAAERHACPAGRERNLTRQQRDDANVHQSEVEEDLRRQQPEAEVVLVEMMQQVRSQPQSGDCHHRRMQIANAEPADEAARSAAAHVVHCASAASLSSNSCSAAPRTAPKSAPVTVQKSTPSSVLKTWASQAETDDRQLKCDDNAGQVAHIFRGRCGRPMGIPMLPPRRVPPP